MYEFMERHKDVGAASCKLVLGSGKLDYSCHRGFPTPENAFFYFFTPFAKIFPRTKLFTGYTQGWKLSDPKPHEVDAISGAFFLVRKKAADEVGWWDEDYFWYGEDLEFCYNLKEKGWRVMFLPNITTLHHKGVTSGIKGHSRSISSASRETKLRSVVASTDVMRIFYKKHYEEKYPKLVSFIVFTGIALLEKIRTSFL
jgi:GT2 family glycosyltransferase